MGRPASGGSRPPPGHSSGPHLRDGLEDGIDLLLKVHVEQAVGLVQHQMPQRAQRKALCVGQVVHYAPGRADHHVRPARKRHRLRHHVDASDQHGAAHGDAGAQSLNLLGDLDGQLARGRQDQRSQGCRAVEQCLEDGQSKGARLAAARLRQPNYILACSTRAAVR